MNIVPYEVKRAHWAMTSTAMRKFIDAAETEKKPELALMTPARYDILHMMAERFWWKRKPGRREVPRTNMPLGELIDVLGLHPSTISKTVKRMAELELVMAFRMSHDFRRVALRMTELGWKALKAARALFTKRPRGFFRATLGRWCATLGMPDRIGSLRGAQRWARTLASTFGLTSRPIHDGRFDHDRAAHSWPQSYDYIDGELRAPPATCRKRVYG